MRSALVVVTCLLLAGCGGVAEHRSCVSSHTEMRMVPAMMGKNISLQPRMVNVCDEWESEGQK